MTIFLGGHRHCSYQHQLQTYTQGLQTAFCGYRDLASMRTTVRDKAAVPASSASRTHPTPGVALSGPSGSTTADAPVDSPDHTARMQLATSIGANPRSFSPTQDTAESAAEEKGILSSIKSRINKERRRFRSLRTAANSGDGGGGGEGSISKPTSPRDGDEVPSAATR
jgi:hypothetical protein